MDSIIKAIRSKRHEFDQHIAKITGRRYVPKPRYYKNTETGEDYYALAGALAFPVGRTPGFAVIVSALKDGENHMAPTLKVVDEFEDLDLEELLDVCEKRRYRWGYPNQLEFFYGDPVRFLQTVCKFNERLKTKADFSGGFYLSQPSGFENQNRTEVYLQQIRSLLRPPDNGGKRLILGDCQRLRSHIQNMPADVQKIEDHPAVAALAYAVHSMVATSPWLKFVQHQQYRPTINSDFGYVDSWPWEDENDENTDDGLVETFY